MVTLTLSDLTCRAFARGVRPDNRPLLLVAEVFSFCWEENIKRKFIKSKECLSLDDKHELCLCLPPCP